ncbi:hypothetical protein DFJ74DRAFT_652010 [Hyaloraphidium curvatum]|nr:hypothetical protein DFJ74DRAFT_652010 [Hyaloraphidium curvatum]
MAARTGGTADAGARGLLAALARFSLDAALPDNAAFLAERLCALAGDDGARCLLAAAHLRRGRHAQVLALLRASAHKESRYLLALACRALGRLQEAEIHMQELLADGDGTDSGFNIVEPAFRVELERSAVLCTNGFICKDANRTEQAKEYFFQALDENPFLWCAFQSLCHMGVDVDVDSIFDVAKAVRFLRGIPGLVPASIFSSSSQPRAASSHTTAPDRPPSVSGRENMSGMLEAPAPPQSRPRPAFTYGLRPHNGQELGRAAGPATSAASSSSSLPGPRSRSTPPDPAEAPPASNAPAQLEPPPAPKPAPAPKTKRVAGAAEPAKTAPQTRKTRTAAEAAPASSLSSVQTRRSARAVGGAGKPPAAAEAPAAAAGSKDRKRTAKGAGAPSKDADVDIKMDDASPVTGTSASDVADGIDWTEVAHAVEALFAMLRPLAVGYAHLCQFRCREAFECFASAQPEQYNTGWVLCQAAKAQFEMAEYRRCEQLFLQARELEPYRMEDMEVFSVALWHMHKEVELSYLAHDLVELDKKRPQAWCAVGNSFSLKQEHDLALKCFQRAIQLDPHFAYAYTLAGHEYIANEDLDKAQSCFRSALRVDERHYNAWYGLGYLFYRQEKLQMAKFHFESALQINKASPILTYYIGMVLQNTDRKDEALLKYEEALEMSPKNPLFRFAKAEVLSALGRHREALAELKSLSGYTQEPNVYFLMGKVYRALGDNRNALLAFTKSDTRGSNGKSSVIKDQIERLQNEAEDMSD